MQYLTGYQFILKFNTDVPTKSGKPRPTQMAYNYLKAGRLTGKLINGQIKISEAEYDRFVAEYKIRNGIK